MIAGPRKKNAEEEEGRRKKEKQEGRVLDKKQEMDKINHDQAYPLL